MKQISKFIVGRLAAGLLVFVPIFLALLLFARTVELLAGVLQPIAKLLPKWLPAPNILALFLVLIGCFFIGVGVCTSLGHAVWEKIEKSLFQKIPGYALARSLTQRMAGESEDQAWKPALAEIEDALVPAFIIEELDNGSFTVFVPSVPTPLAGAVYVLTADRVHVLNVSFTYAIKVISRWGSGSAELVAAMETQKQIAKNEPEQARPLSA